MSDNKLTITINAGKYFSHKITLEKDDKSAFTEDEKQKIYHHYHFTPITFSSSAPRVNINDIPTSLEKISELYDDEGLPEMEDN
jgi:hypothetical protein